MVTSQKEMSEGTSKYISKVAKGGGASLMGSVAGRCLWLACQVMLARSFGSEVFGLYVLGFVVLRITELLSRLGLDIGAMRFVSIHQKDNPGKVKGLILSATMISLFFGIFMGGVVYVIAGHLSEKLFHNPELTGIIRAFAVSIPFMASMMVIAAISRGFLTTKYSVYIKDIVQPSVYALLVLLFITLKYSIFWVIIAYAFSQLLAVIVGFYFLSRQFPRIKDRALKPIYETKKLLKYSAPLLISSFLVFLMTWTATIMLGYMETPKEVGIYRVATQIPILLLLISTASNSIYAPVIAELHNLNQIERLSKIFKMTSRFVFFLTLPIAIFLIFSARDMMFIFGRDYVNEGVPVFIVLSIAQFINCATGGVGNTLSMTGKQNVTMVNNIIMIAINITLNFFLIRLYGVFGAAVATAITIGSVNLLRLLEVYLIYKIHPYSLSYLYGITSGVIASTLLYLLGKHWPISSSVLGLLTNACVVIVAFLLPFFVIGLRGEDKLLFEKVVNKLNSKIPIFNFLARTNAK